MINRIVVWSWDIFPSFMILATLVFGFKLMFKVVEHSYPFELLACGVIGMMMIFLICFFIEMNFAMKENDKNLFRKNKQPRMNKRF